VETLNETMKRSLVVPFTQKSLYFFSKFFYNNFKRNFVTVMFYKL